MAGRMDELPIDIKKDGGEVWASDEGGNIDTGKGIMGVRPNKGSLTWEGPGGELE